MVSCVLVCNLQCTACLGDIDPLVSYPRHADGSVAVAVCIELGICPLCRSARGEFSDEDLRRILRRLRRR